MRVRSLILFDLRDTIIHSNTKVLEFIHLYGIKNKTDINNLFVFFALTHILEIYKNNKNGLVAFYFSLDDYNKLQEKGEINYSKFIKIIMKKIKFPITISSFSFSYFCATLANDCPEYDEIIDSYIFLPSIFDDIIKIIKKLSFYKLEKELLSDIKNRIKLLTIFEK